MGGVILERQFGLDHFLVLTIAFNTVSVSQLINTVAHARMNGSTVTKNMPLIANYVTAINIGSSKQI